MTAPPTITYDFCPWCNAPEVTEYSINYIFWKCGSSVGKTTGDPMQSINCKDRERRIKDDTANRR